MTNYLLPLFFYMPFVFCVTYMLRWAEANTIFSVKRLLQVSDFHDVLSAFEEDETSAMAMVYIVPNDGEIIDEDSADEDDGELVDNLSGSQFNAMVGAV